MYKCIPVCKMYTQFTCVPKTVQALCYMLLVYIYYSMCVCIPHYYVLCTIILFNWIEAAVSINFDRYKVQLVIIESGFFFLKMALIQFRELANLHTAV